MSEDKVEFSTVPTKYGIGDLHLEGMLFDPQPDATPLDSMWFAIMLKASTSLQEIDYKTFIRKHKLDRHFREV